MDYALDVKTARMNAVLTKLGSGAYIEIGTTGMGVVLATIPLANPAGTVAGKVLTFDMPQSDTSADATGTAAEAVIKASGGADVITGLTVGVSASDINLVTTSIVATQEVKIESGSITHA